MNSERLSQMKTGSSLVNVARGAVVDTDALIQQLNSGRISAALDVTDPEPLPDGHPLWSSPNLIISPHVGGDSAAFEPRIKRLIKHQLELLSNGNQLINIVAGPRKIFDRKPYFLYQTRQKKWTR
jgi:phosphoglycerate dehydrogenase-like enzyme